MACSIINTLKGRHVNTMSRDTSELMLVGSKLKNAIRSSGQLDILENDHILKQYCTCIEQVIAF